MADADGHPLLEVTDLRKSYGDRVVLDDVVADASSPTTSSA